MALDKVLIVDDDKNICDLLRLYLEKEGYGVILSHDGDEAVAKFNALKPDLILLDIMLPGVVGYELMEYIKNLGIPVIFITAKARLEDKIKGFKLGADDYITKPFELAELTARVEAVLKRYYKTQSRISVAGMEIDTLSRTVKKNGRLVELTAKEYDLFLVFLRNRNIALYRERIYEEVWGGEYDPDSRTVDIHVQRLKRKMGLEDYIISVRGIGYRFEVSET